MPSAQECSQPKTPRHSSFASRFAHWTDSDSDTVILSEDKLGGKGRVDVADNVLSDRYPLLPPLPMSSRAPLTPKPRLTPKADTDSLSPVPTTPQTNWGLRTPSPDRFYWSGRMSSSSWGTSHTSGSITTETRFAGELWKDTPEVWNTVLPFSDTFDDSFNRS
jgi:hypothetical protein